MSGTLKGRTQPTVQYSQQQILRHNKCLKISGLSPISINSWSHTRFSIRAFLGARRADYCDELQPNTRTLGISNRLYLVTTGCFSWIVSGLVRHSSTFMSIQYWNVLTVLYYRKDAIILNFYPNRRSFKVEIKHLIDGVQILIHRSTAQSNRYPRKVHDYIRLEKVPGTIE